MAPPPCKEGLKVNIKQIKRRVLCILTILTLHLEFISIHTSRGNFEQNRVWLLFPLLDASAKFKVSAKNFFVFLHKEEERRKDTLCPCLQISASGCVGAGLGVVVCLLMFAIMPSKLVVGDGG